MYEMKDVGNIPESNIRESNIPESKFDRNKFGVRHGQVIMMFFLLAIAIGMRVQLSVAVVAMTDNTTCPNPDVPTYDWDNKSVILSSFYWCYFVLQILAGTLGKTYGTKNILLISMSVNVASCILVPLAAKVLGSYGVMACRMLQGLSQGSFYPSVINLLGNWSPALEKTRLGTMAYIGGSFGIIVSQPLVGYISSTWIGWPVTFYLYGSTGILWIIIWFFYGADSPSQHNSISIEERNYIEESRTSTDNEIEFKNIPWKAIFTSMPLWALTCSFFGQVWIGITQSTELPTYMNKIMLFDVQTVGLISSIPDLTILIFSYPMGMVTDYILEKKYVSITPIRTFITAIPYIFASLTMLALTYLPSDAKFTAILVLILNGFCTALTMSGASINHVDLSPKYSGIIMSISNSISMVIAPLAPLMIQTIVKDESDVLQWRTIFIITVIVVTVTMIFYLFYGSGEVQWWNFYGEDNIVDINEIIREKKLRKVSCTLSINLK